MNPPGWVIVAVQWYGPVLYATAALAVVLWTAVGIVHLKDHRRTRPLAWGPYDHGAAQARR